MHILSKMILGLLGWKAIGYEKLRVLPKYIIAIGPHTSNWDFPLGILVRSAYKLDRIKFLGKDSLFKAPHGFLFRALGGYPVVRIGKQNQVESYIQAFKQAKELAIVIAPEGTRKKVDKLRTGYYFIAKGADIPIIPSIMNYKTRIVIFGEPFYPTSDVEADLARLNDFFKLDCGKYPELGFSG